MSRANKVTTTHFRFGRIITTPGARAACPAERMQVCLLRHSLGDWGELSADDKAANDAALLGGDRLLSSYRIDPAAPEGSAKIWIVTEEDRSVTTVLLPSEY